METEIAPRIALFSGNYDYTKDGSNQALNLLVAFLERERIAVRVYSPTADHPAFVHAGTVVSVPSIRIPTRREYRVALGLPREIIADIRAFRPNLFHLSAPDPLGLRAQSLARKWAIPTVASVHTRFESYLRYYHLGWLECSAKAYLKHIYRRCAQIYAPSESAAEALRRDGACADVRIWSRGIDTEVYSPTRKDRKWLVELGIRANEVVVLFVGRLVLEKGLRVFAETIRLLEIRNIPHRVLVVGQGPRGDWFRRLMPRAVFAGPLKGEELARAYASADIFFNPSTTETFGNVTLEAMASGIPTVCADAIGSKSLVLHGTTGYLCSDLASAYGDRIVYLIANPAVRTALGVAAHRRSRSFQWENANQELLKCYREVIARSRGATKAA
jgi:phosphatidylinositol alpha 1,6-mannosyltransferase